MTKSEAINELAGALAKAQAVMAGAAKDSTNPHFRSKYADLASIWDACRPALTANGLSVAQAPSVEGHRVSLTTLLLHSSGQFLESNISAVAKDDGPQAIGSVITYLRRYSLASIAGVAPEDDDAEHGEARNHNGNMVVRPMHTPARQESAREAVAPERSEDSGGSLPPGFTLIAEVRSGRAGAKGELILPSGESLLFYKEKLKTPAMEWCQNRIPVELTIKKSTSGNRYVDDITPLPPPITDAELDALANKQAKVGLLEAASEAF